MASLVAALMAMARMLAARLRRHWCAFAPPRKAIARRSRLALPGAIRDNAHARRPTGGPSGALSGDSGVNGRAAGPVHPVLEHHKADQA
jgi:hypothetical protein